VTLAAQAVDWMDNSMFSLALCAALGLAVGLLLGRLIGAGRDFTGVMGLVGLVVGVALFGISTHFWEA
jgi:hypothetical protein